MLRIVYFVITFLATLLGAVTGMGGGVLIKPILDMLGHYDVASIAMLSSVTVFSMSLVALFRQREAVKQLQVKRVVPLSAGSVAGGIAGGMLFNFFVADTKELDTVTITQNAVLAVLVMAVVVYTRNKNKLPSFHAEGWIPALCTGLFLGIVSSFLGIGGGPINVAVVVFVFSLSIKSAALYSLTIILFSQATKLIYTAVFDGFARYDLHMLPVMLIGAILGGFVGGSIARRLEHDKTDKLFQYAQIAVLAICVINILRFSLL